MIIFPKTKSSITERSLNINNSTSHKSKNVKITIRYKLEQIHNKNNFLISHLLFLMISKTQSKNKNHTSSKEINKKYNNHTTI
jgi:hypothetical protein